MVHHIIYTHNFCVWKKEKKKKNDHKTHQNKTTNHMINHNKFLTLQCKILPSFNCKNKYYMTPWSRKYYTHKNKNLFQISINLTSAKEFATKLTQKLAFEDHTMGYQIYHNSVQDSRLFAHIYQRYEWTVMIWVDTSSSYTYFTCFFLNVLILGKYVFWGTEWVNFL